MSVNAARRRVVVVASEEVGNAPRSGYQERGLGVVSALSEDFDVTVVFPRHLASTSPMDGRHVALDGWAPRSLPRQVASLAFARGAFHQRNAWSGRVKESLSKTLRDLQPEVVVWLGAYTYFAAEGRRLDKSWLDVVQFDDIERQRQRSLLVAGPGKVRVRAISDLTAALFWEPRAARDADLSVAMTEVDAKELRRWATQVIVVPNGITARPHVPSSQALRIVTMAVWKYSANTLGLKRFLDQDWPRIRSEFPDAVLDVVGGGAADALGTTVEALAERGVVAHGFVHDPTPLFGSAMLFLAPAVSGGGSQLKISQAIGFGRVTFGPAHLARELDDDRRQFVVPSTDLARDICSIAHDRERRHRMEEAAVGYSASHTWTQQARDLSDWIAARGQSLAR